MDQYKENSFEPACEPQHLSHQCGPSPAVLFFNCNPIAHGLSPLLVCLPEHYILQKTRVSHVIQFL